jgi:hypothetical protein
VREAVAKVYSQVPKEITLEKSGAMMKEAGFAARFFASSDDSAIPQKGPPF